MVFSNTGNYPFLAKRAKPMKLRYFLAIIAFLGIGSAYAQTLLQQFEPGFRLINGSQLNLMVNTVNSLTGKAGTPGAVSGTTGTFTGAVDGASGEFNTLTVNGNNSLICTSFNTMGAPAALTDVVFFVATRPLLLVTASQVHAVAAGGASAAQLTKDSTTAAPGAGTDLLSAAFDLNATANTVQVGALVASAATKTFAAGDRLAIDWTAAVQASSGVAVTACFAPI